MDAPGQSRLSVFVVDVQDRRGLEFQTWATAFVTAFSRHPYGRADVTGDEGKSQRFYVVRRWTDAGAAVRYRTDPEMQQLTARLHAIARVTHVVNGTLRPDTERRLLLDDERTAPFEADRRSGFHRRISADGRAEGDRRGRRDRRLGPRRLRNRVGEVDLVGAARRAREQAEAVYSQRKVGAALESAVGAVFTGCNIENATYGLTMCAERVALFKALSEGHRAFTRLAIVVDGDVPAPPCGACRQMLWEFGGNLEIQLANLVQVWGTHRLHDLLPLPFDARLLMT